jgi:hypothetical protein
MCNCGARRRAAEVARAAAAAGRAAAPVRGRTLAGAPTVPPAPPPMTTTQLVMRRVRGRNIRVVETVPVVVDTAVWGPPLWQFLHSAGAVAGGEEHREAWVALLTALRGSLPCPDCHEHYNAWWSARPFVADSSGEPVEMWLLALHNAVNERRGVPVWTVEQLEATYPVEAGGRDVAAAALEAAAAVGVGAAAVAAGRALLAAISRE